MRQQIDELQAKMQDNFRIMFNEIARSIQESQ